MLALELKTNLFDVALREIEDIRFELFPWNLGEKKPEDLRERMKEREMTAMRE